MTAEFSLRSDEQGRLHLSQPGEDEKHDVRVRRSFPWSKPLNDISIRDADGKELLLLDDLRHLSPEQRTIIEQALESMSFIPRITRVENVDVRFGHQQWRVQTDRGPVEFRVQEREDIRFLPDGRFRIKDADGNIFELAPLESLDEQSRRAIEPLL